MDFASLFAGIAGFDLGLEQAGMRSVAQVERDQHCLNVLRRHFPRTERSDDVCKFGAAVTVQRPRLLCGGFPCQDLSVAGKRAGLAGNRSGLFWEFMRSVEEFRPDWVLLENVPGLLSSNGGRDMGAVVGALAERGYWWAYRVLDSQYFGLAQRRKRVFIVGHSGDRTYPARVLFESEGLPWDPPPSRKAGARVAASLTAGTASGSGVNAPGRRREDDVNLVSGQWWDGSDVTPCLDSSMLAKQQMMPEKGRFAAVIQSVTHTLRAEGHDASEDGTGRGVPLVPCVAATLNSGGNSGGFRTEPGEHVVVTPIDMRQASRGDKMTNNRREGSTGGAPGTGIGDAGDPSPTLADSHTPAVVYQCHGGNIGPMGTLRSGNGNETGGVPFVAFSVQAVASEGNGPHAREVDVTKCLDTHGGNPDCNNGGTVVATRYAVRRLMPIECERLQGFADNWTEFGADGKRISNSQRYKMLGNAVSVPVIEWIGRRMMRVEGGVL